MFGDDLAVQQQAIEEYIREVEAEYEWQRRRLRLTRTLRQELHHMRKLLEIRRVKMIVGSIAIVLAAAILAGATGQGPLAPLLTRAQHTPFVWRLGCHINMLARKTRDPIAAKPPAGVWPGPFSG